MHFWREMFGNGDARNTPWHAKIKTETHTGGKTFNCDILGKAFTHKAATYENTLLHDSMFGLNSCNCYYFVAPLHVDLHEILLSEGLKNLNSKCEGNYLAR